MAKAKKTLFISIIAIIYILIAYFLFINKHTKFDFNSKEPISTITKEEREKIKKIVKVKPAVLSGDYSNKRNSIEYYPNLIKEKREYIKDSPENKPNVIASEYLKTGEFTESEISQYYTSRLDSLLSATSLLLDSNSKADSKSNVDINPIVKHSKKIIGVAGSGTLARYSFKGYKYSVSPDESLMKKWFDKVGLNPNRTSKWSKTWVGRIGSKIVRRFMVFLMVSDVVWLIQELIFPNFTLLQMFLTSIAIGLTFLILFMYLTKKGIFIH